MVWFQRHNTVILPTNRHRGGKFARLWVESLEERLAPATLSVDATHSFVSQLATAHAGDVIQIEPTGTLGTLGVTATTLSGTVSPGATSVSVPLSFAPGQVIVIDAEVALIDAVSGSVGNFTLTLHAPLASSHNSGAPVTPVANTLGIAKAVTIQGDPAHVPAPLFGANGINLEYFVQNGTPGPDTLHNLALTVVSGTTSGNLAITGNKFNVTTGSIDPISVTSGGALTISSNTISIGPAATIQDAVFGITNAGTITYAGNSITVNGSLGTAGVGLLSSTGPINMTGDGLTVSGTCFTGIILSSSGDVSVSSATVNIAGAVNTGFYVIDSANCTLTSISITLGAAVTQDGLLVDPAGDLVMNGTNTVTVTGAVTDDGVKIVGSAAVSVANLTVNLKSSVANNAVELTPTGSLTLSNANVTVAGNVGAAGMDLNSGGSMAIANMTVLLEGTADNGAIVAGGAVTLSGTESVTVDGSVGANGMNMESARGDFSVANGLTLILKSTVVDQGLEVNSQFADLTISGAVNVQIGGAVSGDGASFIAADNLTMAAVTMTISGTAGAGLDVTSTTLTANGPVNVNVTGNVAGEGVYLDAGGADLAVTNSITATLGGNAASGLELSAGGGITDSGAITVNVAGSAANDGVDFQGNADVTLSGIMNVTVTGAANNGLSLTSTQGSITDVTGINVTVQGALTLDGDGAYVNPFDDGTLAKVKVTADDVGGGNGLEFDATDGSLSLSNATVIANQGTTFAHGASLTTGLNTGNSGVYAPVTATGLSITMTGSASSGLAVLAGSSATVSNATVAVSADVIIGGVSITAGSGLTVGGLAVDLPTAISNSGILLKAGLGLGSVTVNGPLSVTVFRTVGSGLSIDGGDTVITGKITVNVTGGGIGEGSAVSIGAAAFSDTAAITVTAAGPIDADCVQIGASSGSATLSGAITVNVMGDVLSDGIDISAVGALSVSGTLGVTLGGTAKEGLSLSSSKSSVTDTAAFNVLVKGALVGSSTEAAADVEAGTNVTLGNVTVTADDVGACAGLLVTANGLLSLHTATVAANAGSNTSDGVELNDVGGPIVASGITVTMNGQAASGVEVGATAESVTLAGIAVTVAGAVADAGITVLPTNLLTVSGLSVNLQSTAPSGISLTATRVVVSGSGPPNNGLSATIVGAATDGISLTSSGAGLASITGNISINLDATAADGLEISSNEGGLLDTGAITVAVTGNVSDAGVYLDVPSNITLAGNVKINLGGTAAYGLEVLDPSGVHGVVTNTGAITVSVAGQVGTAGADFEGAQVALGNIAVTLLNGSAEDGVDVVASENLSIAGLTLHVTGAVADTGLSIHSLESSVNAANLNVNLSSTAASGILESAVGNLTVKGLTLVVGGNLSVAGVSLGAHVAANLSTMTVTLQGTSTDPFKVDSEAGNLTVTGLTLHAAGAVADDGVKLSSSAGNVAFTNSTITLGSTVTNDAVLGDAAVGDLSFSAVNVTAAGLVGAGFVLTSQGNMTVAGNTITLNGGVTNDALSAASAGGNLTISKNTIATKVNAAAGIAPTATGFLMLTNNSVTLNGGTGPAAILNAGSGNPQSIENNLLTTTGNGAGLAFSGGAAVQALVQGNNFQNNQIGVAIVGDGTNAGTIDLGGGLRGSLGLNTFKNDLTFAVALTNTDADALIDAIGDLFTAGELIQDATHNGGTGTIVK